MVLSKRILKSHTHTHKAAIMPPRVARSTVQVNKPTNARNKSHKRNLNALSIASRAEPERFRIAQHRLGESESFEPRQKRRRLQDDEEDDNDEEHASNARRLQAKTVTKRTDGARPGGLDEEEDMGSDSEGNEWRMGGEIGEDSDSDIDSDEAFGSSDEEKFEGFTFRGSRGDQGPKKKKSKTIQRKMDLNEDMEEDEESDDEFRDEGVDLATMLDDPQSSDEEMGDARKGTTTEGSSDEDEYSGDEDDGAESETSASEPESEADDANPEKLSKLQDLIASLDTDAPIKKTGPRSADIHESQQPSDFGLSSSQKLKISDLLPTVTDPALRKSLKVLASDKPSNRTGVPGKLDAPLPKRHQDKLDRTAANQKAKETLERWRDTVIQNRRADFLQFPLKDPKASEKPGTNTMVATQQSKPQTDLENVIQNILEESGLGQKTQDDEEDQIQQAEELKMKHIPLDEVMARRAELRKNRELMFREEVKARRIKKIKSKAYRRVHRKERERQAEAERDFFDPEGEGLDDNEKDKQDRRRAEERMGAKHRESKWAKGAKKAGRTVWDDDAREGMVEMARRNEELRRRIEGKEIRNDDETNSDMSDDDDDESDFDDDSDGEKVKLRSRLDKLSAHDDDKASGIEGMAFMKRADAARKADNDAAVEQLRRELAGEASEDDQDADTTVGRRIFGPASKAAEKPQPKPKRPEMEEGSESEDDAEIIVDGPVTKGPQPRKLKSILSRGVPSKAVETKSAPVDDDDPWLTAATGKKSKKQSESQEYIPSSNINAVANGTVAKKTTKPVKQPKTQSKAAAASAPDTDGWTTVPYTNGKDTAEASDSDNEPSNPMLAKQSQQAAYHARAFAGDDVDLAFDDEKALQTTTEDAQESSNFLPGWGNWAGSGLSKGTRKANKQSLHNPLFKTRVEGVRAVDRKDAQLKNVIISEAQQRKGKKYLATALPHGYERKEQYERALRQPVGPEWSTKEVFQRNTRPRVVVKQGVVEAMDKPLV